MTNDHDNPRALVTGATGGLGSEFVTQLAQRGYDLLLVDRPGLDLQQLSDQLSEQHGVNVDVQSTDLTNDDDVERLVSRIKSDVPVDLLVNNAGFGHSLYFVDLNVKTHLDTIGVHVLAPVRLAHAVLPGMIERDRGAIINVSSMSAWTPGPCTVQYAATKAYLVVFSEALQEELVDTKVRVQALCPGFVKTPFFEQAGMKTFNPGRVPKSMWVTPEKVVACSLDHLSGKKVIVVPGTLPRIVGRLARMPIARPFVRVLVRQERPTVVDDHDDTTGN